MANRVGVPQGNVLSPLAANIYLNKFCLTIAEKTPCKIITYADDFVILHKKEFSQAQRDWFGQRLNDLGLELNTRKTRVVNMNLVGAEFKFLGFSFKKVKGFIRNTVYTKIQPSKASQTRLKDSIRAIVKHRTSMKLEDLIKKVNPILRGWWNYYRLAGYPKQVFFRLDWFVVGRFYRWSKRLSQRQGKYLAQDAWRKLKALGLFMLQPFDLASRREGCSKKTCTRAV